MTRTATAADIVARLQGSQYPLTAIDALGWGMGPAQINITDAVAEAARQGLVVISTSRGKQMVALAETHPCGCPVNVVTITVGSHSEECTHCKKTFIDPI